MESSWHCLGCTSPLTSLPMRGWGVLRPCRLTHIHSNPLRKPGAGWRQAPGVRRCHSSLSNPTVTEPPATPHVFQHPDVPSASSAPPRSGAYPFTEIEQKWQQHWQQHQTFRTPDISELDTSKPKFYALDMFPYPSGAGLHVGHPEGYTATDIMARYKRMTGHNVLHPMGWDAFGLPAEAYAIQTGTHPAETTAKNIARFRQQLQSLGFSYDWSREIATTDPEYYKWTQWIFLQLFNKGLAYQAEVPVNWCPALGTVLANEEVIDGKSERGGHPVQRMPMKQWMLRITAYADRLLEDLEGLDWSDSIKDMQRNWIGRSEGADITFQLQPGNGTACGNGKTLKVYTTRPDTLFGVTYMVLAPEHPLVQQLTTPEQQQVVQQYVAAAGAKSDLERTELQKEKSGVSTGSHAINPATGEAIPIWVADYVLGSYGSGAIMAVPAHDTRDFEFAQTFGLPVRQVVQCSAEEEELPTAGHGTAVNSSSASSKLALDGLPTMEAQQRVIDWLEQHRLGQRKVNFKLRDWLFARQRYWGEPFPIIYPEGSEEAVPIPESELPLLLPAQAAFHPTGRPDPPLAKVTDWVNTTDPATGRPATREASTMPQWAGSCWYYLRFLDPLNSQQMLTPEAEKYWMPVDLYVGGAEHAVLHLLYARFWHKVLYDLGVVTTKEPFQRLVSQGMILGEVEYTAHQNPDGSFAAQEGPRTSAVRVAAEEVQKQGDKLVWGQNPGARLSARAHKMSKSRGNVINPDDVVHCYGADSLRLYEMFLGPLQETKVWSTKNIDGVHRFLARVWRLIAEQGTSDCEPSQDQMRLLHATIKKVTEETEAMRFNTGIAAMMEFVNGAYKWDTRPRAVLAPFVLLLAAYAPHLGEEMWQGVAERPIALSTGLVCIYVVDKKRWCKLVQQAYQLANLHNIITAFQMLGNPGSLAYEPWPQYDETRLVEDSIKLPVQVNGKMRGTVQVPADIDQQGAVQAAYAVPGIAKFTDGKPTKKIIFVANRILNIIVGK